MWYFTACIRGQEEKNQATYCCIIIANSGSTPKAVSFQLPLSDITRMSGRIKNPADLLSHPVWARQHAVINISSRVAWDGMKKIFRFFLNNILLTDWSKYVNSPFIGTCTPDTKLEKKNSDELHAAAFKSRKIGDPVARWLINYAAPSKKIIFLKIKIESPLQLRKVAGFHSRDLKDVRTAQKLYMFSPTVLSPSLHIHHWKLRLCQVLMVWLISLFPLFIS